MSPATNIDHPGANHIVLVGMMGAGKTTVGRALAARLGVAYADNDDELRRRTGRDAAALVADVGAEELHTIEHDILATAVRRHDGSVVGAPGSVALDAHAPTFLAGQRVVWLRATLETLVARVHHDPVRPLLGTYPATALAGLMRKREPGFARLANLIVDVDGLSVDAVVDAVMSGQTG
jgi:shikimate kinase